MQEHSDVGYPLCYSLHFSRAKAVVHKCESRSDATGVDTLRNYSEDATMIDS